MKPHTKLRPVVTDTLGHRASPEDVLRKAIAPAVVPVSFTPAQRDILCINKWQE